jgi:hypothetical protein
VDMSQVRSSSSSGSSSGSGGSSSSSTSRRRNWAQQQHYRAGFAAALHVGSSCGSCWSVVVPLLFLFDA